MRISIRSYLLWLALWLCLGNLFALDRQNNELNILCYNVENFFHPDNDSTTQDDEFTAEGVRHWTYSRYTYKADMIAKVITNSCGHNHPAIVGLCEVENESCMKALCYRVRNLRYRYIHYDSPDPRGIDVAMLYDTTILKTDTTYPIRIYLDENTTTRDILYARYTLKTLETSKTLETQETFPTLHVFLCHFPSQLGGSAETSWKREKALAVLQGNIDTILANEPEAQIIAMGDFNSNPLDNLTNMTNLSLRTQKNGIREDKTSDGRDKLALGTHKYNGIWTQLDQFYVSQSLINKTRCTIYDAPYLLERDEKYLGYKPKRTYVGMKYQSGYSDHLPIILKLQL